MAFVKLFPLGFGDPTKPDRLYAVSETDVMAHLLRFAEKDPLDGKLYYPFAEHYRFKFWMNDRIRRHRTLSQATVYLKKNPEDAALTIDDLRQMVSGNTWQSLMKRLSAYSANLTGSDAYWYHRRQELQAIFQQEVVVSLSLHSALRITTGKTFIG